MLRRILRSVDSRSLLCCLLFMIAISLLNNHRPNSSSTIQSPPFQFHNPDCVKAKFGLDSPFYHQYLQRRDFAVHWRSSLPDRFVGKYFFAVNTSPKNYQARIAIRQTWKKYLDKNTAHNNRCAGSLKFFIGQTSDLRIAHNLQREYDSHSDDMVMLDYCDNYLTLPLKTLRIMTFLRNNLPKSVDYVVKIDDDVFPNLPVFFDCFPKVRQEEFGIYGWCTVDDVPHDPADKYRVPISAYNGTKFPIFAHGPAYLIATRHLPALLQSAESVPFINLEDVWWTGMVAEKAGVNRTDLPRFLGSGKTKPDLARNLHKTWRAGFFYHGVGPKLMQRTWTNSNTTCCGCTEFCWRFKLKPAEYSQRNMSSELLMENY